MWLLIGGGVIAIILLTVNSLRYEPVWVSRYWGIKEDKFSNYPRATRIAYANANLVRDYALKFAQIEGRCPKNFDELMNSAYVPPGDFLINPYTGEPVKAVGNREASPGDIKWDLIEEVSGAGSREFLWITVFFEEKPESDIRSIQLGTVCTSENANPKHQEYLRRLRAWMAQLSERESRTYWMCERLGEVFTYSEPGMWEEIAPASLQAADRIIRRRFPARLVRNPWTGRRMRGVPANKPSPGDYTYVPPQENKEHPRLFEIICYGEGGRIIFPMPDEGTGYQQETIKRS